MKNSVSVNKKKVCKLPQKEIMDQLKNEYDSVVLIADLDGLMKDDTEKNKVSFVTMYAKKEHDLLVEKVKNFSARNGTKCTIKTILIFNN